MQNRKGMKLFLTILCVLGWFALAGQFYLIIKNRTASVAETIIRYFSFFTILTNLLVAVCCTTLMSDSNSGLKKFFSKQTTLTATAVYISIVGAVYNLILRFLWQPQGLQLIIDELLHSVIPVLFVLFWLFFTAKGNIHWRKLLVWLIYPLAYLLIVLLRGASSSFYPYPLVDVAELGYKKVFINSAGMLLAFLAVSVIFILLDRSKKVIPL